MELPVCIEVKSPWCSDKCVTKPLSFAVPPIAGDLVDFQAGDKRVVATVSHTHHVVTLGGVSQVVYCAVQHHTIQELVDTSCVLHTLFGWYPSKMYSAVAERVSDRVADGVQRPFHVIVCALWGKNEFDTTTDSPTALAELFKAMMQSVDVDAKKVVLAVELVHRIIIDYKIRQRRGTVGLDELIRQWDNATGLAATLELASLDDVIARATGLLSNLKSVEYRQLPKCVKERLHG